MRRSCIRDNGSRELAPSLRVCSPNSSRRQCFYHEQLVRGRVHGRYCSSPLIYSSFYQRISGSYCGSNICSTLDCLRSHCWIKLRCWTSGKTKERSHHAEKYPSYFYLLLLLLSWILWIMCPQQIEEMISAGSAEVDGHELIRL